MEVVDPGGLRWFSTTYVANNGMVSSTTAPHRLADREPSVAGASGFVIADNLLNGPLVGMSVNFARRRGVGHYALAGTVDSRVVRMVVELGDAERKAQLAPDTLTIAVETPPAGSLTALGRRRARRMPDAVTLRPYLVTFPQVSSRARGLPSHGSR